MGCVLYSFTPTLLFRRFLKLRVKEGWEWERAESKGNETWQRSTSILFCDCDGFRPVGTCKNTALFCERTGMTRIIVPRSRMTEGAKIRERVLAVKQSATGDSLTMLDENVTD